MCCYSALITGEMYFFSFDILLLAVSLYLFSMLPMFFLLVSSLVFSQGKVSLVSNGQMELYFSFLFANSCVVNSLNHTKPVLLIEILFFYYWKLQYFQCLKELYFINVYVCWNQQIQTSLCTKIHIHTYIYNTRYQSVFEPTKWNLSVSLIFYHSKKVPLLQQVFCWIYMHMHVCKFNQCLMLASVILPTFA